MSQPVIIVGAPRSGTNMLRDVMTSMDGFATWPCDEINLLWKHGNLDVPHDQLGPRHARPEVVRYMERQFETFARANAAHTVVEKTCATSLRVAFVAKVFPSAKFIFIHRDGLDAAASTIKRWNAPFDWRYTVKKVRWVPKRDLPAHLGGFIGKKARQLRSGDARREGAERLVSTWWGPRPHDFAELQKRYGLDELAILQWRRCVDVSMDDLSAIPSDQVIRVAYEDYVRDPHSGTKRILDFLGRSEAFRESATERVRSGSVGRGRSEVSSEVKRRMEAIGGPTLKRMGYLR